MEPSLAYTPSGGLQITIPAAARCTCGHAHPSSIEDWDNILRATNKWIADNAPVCRGFSGVEPWARGDSPSTAIIGKRKTKSPAVESSLTSKASRPNANATAGNSSRPRPQPNSRNTRSAFGCTPCKMRKIKCDERRARPFLQPQLTPANLLQLFGELTQASKAMCLSVWIYVGLGTHATIGGSDTDDEWQPITSTATTAISHTPEPPLTPAAIGRQEPMGRPDQTTMRLPDAASLMSFSHSEAFSGTAWKTPPDAQVISAEALSRLVDAHGLTWFIDASEVVEQQVLASNQRRAFTEHRQAVLERCWRAYIDYHGKLPLTLPSCPPDPAFTSLVAPPGISLPSLKEMTEWSSETAASPAVLAELAQAALLHAFVALGATHFAYWAQRRGMPFKEHLLGAASLASLGLKALLLVLHHLERTISEKGATLANRQDWEEEIQAKILISMSLQIMHRVIGADKLGPAMLRLECEIIARGGGPVAMLKGPSPPPARLEVICAVINDALQGLLRGELPASPPDGDWLDAVPAAHRLIPEGYGVTVQMAKHILETLAVLYGLGEGKPARLKALYRTLSAHTLVGIYASPHPPRVQLGDLLMRQTLIALVCLDGFHLGPTDAQLVAASDAILELFAEAVYGDVYTVRWMLPLLVAGGVASKADPALDGGRDRRAEVERIFDAMADTCGCYDIEAARKLTEQVWERRDGGREWRWIHVLNDTPELNLTFI